MTKDKVALVTGASRGIGYQVALGLAKENVHVIALARTTGGLEELDDEIRQINGTATLVPVGLNDFEAIDRLGDSINERWGKLDILIANAGTLGEVTPLNMMEPKMFDNVFDVNVTANYRLIRALDKMMRQAEYARGVFVTSGAVRNCKAFVGPYAASKAALETMVKCYADEIKNTNVRVNLLDPGTVRTNMRAEYAPGENPLEVTPPEMIVPEMLEMCSQKCQKNGEVFRFTSKNWDS